MKPPEQFPVLNHHLSIPTTTTITVTTTSTTSTTKITTTTAVTTSSQLQQQQDTVAITQPLQNNNNIIVRPPQPQHHLLPSSLKQDTVSRLKPSKYDKQLTAVTKSKAKALDVSNLLPSSKTVQPPPPRDPETPVLNVPDPAKLLASLPSSASLWDYRYSTVRYFSSL